MLKLIHEVEQHGTFVTVLGLCCEEGYVVLIVLDTVAQMERRFIRDWQCEGIAPRTYGGRLHRGKARLDHAHILRMAAEEHGATVIERVFCCSRRTLRRAVSDVVHRLAAAFMVASATGQRSFAPV